MTDELVGELLEAVRLRRAEQAQLAELDRQLEETRRRVLRARPGWDRLDHAISAAEVSSRLTAELWLDDDASALERITKRVIAKVVRWYLRQVTGRVATFAQATVAAIGLLSHDLRAQAQRFDALADRVDALAEELEVARSRSLPPPQALSSNGRVPRASPLQRDENLAQVAVERMRAAQGRVLHADCGAGELVAQLACAGVDAYGTDPSAPLLEKSVRRGLDLRQTDAVRHLGSVAPRGLGGIVLSGCVDRLNPADAYRLVLLLGIRLAPTAPIVVAATHQATWLREAPPVEQDLAPGRPLQPETWCYLLAEHGFTGLETVAGAEPHGFLVTGVRAGY